MKEQNHSQLSTFHSQLNEVPAGYKQTEVGVIPEDWERSRISNIATVVDSLHQTPTFSSTGYAMVRVADIKTGNLNLSGALTVSKEIFEEFTRNYLPKKGDIVLSRVGSYGVSSYVETNEEFCMGQNTVVIQSKIPSKFLYYILNSVATWQQIEDGSYGSGYKSLSLKNINELIIALPTKPEQTAIANALSDVDALIAALEKLINKKSAIKTAAMQQLLTGKKRLPPFDQLNTGYKQTELGEIPGDWEASTLEKVSSQPMQNGLFYEPNRKGKGVYLINVGDMYKSAPISVGELELFDANAAEKKTFKVISGDLFFTRSSIVPSGIAYCNIYESQVLDCELVFDSHLIRLRTNSNIANARYTYLACMATYARKFLIGSAKTATMTTIDQGALKKCPILLPPIEEQTAIANVLSDMDKDLEALQQRLHKTQQIKQGMMQELLTGKTRLVQPIG